MSILIKLQAQVDRVIGKIRYLGIFIVPRDDQSRSNLRDEAEVRGRLLTTRALSWNSKYVRRKDRARTTFEEIPLGISKLIGMCRECPPCDVLTPCHPVDLCVPRHPPGHSLARVLERPSVLEH